MSDFRDQLDADMEDVFLNVDEFAEMITWTPKGGEAATITALVRRSRLSTRPTDGSVALSWPVTITVRRLDVEPFNRNGDTVSVSEVYGGTPVTWRASHLIAQNPTALTIGLSK